MSEQVLNDTNDLNREFENTDEVSVQNESDSAPVYSSAVDTQETVIDDSLPSSEENSVASAAESNMDNAVSIAENNSAEEDSENISDDFDSSDTSEDGEQPATLAGFYEMLASQNGSGSEMSRVLLRLICWNNSVFTYDPFSDQPLTTDLDAYTRRLKDYEDHRDEHPVKDHIFHLVEFIINEIKYLLNGMIQNIYRSHESMPLHSVRETDGKSLQLLARRPGRNIKEKLSGNPVMVAVKRRFTCNTLENQLLKIFLKKLNQLLLLRKKSFEAGSLPYDDMATDLISKISYWKTSEAAEEIGSWKNNPPNNVLLQDRRYRKIWLGWQKLRSFDEIIRRDFQLMPYFVADYIFWEIASFLNSFENCRLFQKPLSRSSKKSPEDFEEKDRFTFFIADGENYYKFRGEKEKVTLRFYLDRKPCGELMAESDVVYMQIDDETSAQVLAEIDLRDCAHQFILQIFLNQGISRDRLKQRQYSDDSCSVMPLLALDLTRSYPRYFNGASERICRFRPMVQFWKDVYDRESRISCEDSRGIFLSHQAADIDSYTFTSILNPSGDTNENSRFKTSDAARELGELVYRKLPAQKLVYAVPDLLDDFDLESIRSGLGYAYGSASSIPASISAVLSAHFSHVLKSCSKGDLIIITDHWRDGIVLTPVLCSYDAKLHKKLPDTEGIQFTRYPTTYIEADKTYKGRNVCKNQDVEKELGLLFDDDGIARNADRASFMIFDGSGQYEHMSSGGEKCRKTVWILRKPQFNKFISECGFIPHRAVKILSLSSHLDLHEIETEYSVIFGNGLKAAGAFESVTHEACLPPDMVLWFDYLPNLSMEAMVQGKKKLWALVNGQRVRPKYNEPVSINISEHFVLPAGKSFFHFPLVKGNAREKTQYEAYIESPQLPLKTELECRLHLTYTYGADNPFNLVFIPVNSSTVEDLQVQWKFKDDIPVDLTAFPVPSFPQRRSMASLEHYISSKDGITGDESNLITEFKELLLQIISSKKCRRHVLDESSSRRINEYFDLYTVETEHGDIKYSIKSNLLQRKKEFGVLRSSSPAYLYEYKSNGKKRQKFFNGVSIRGTMVFHLSNLFNSGWNISDFQSDVVSVFNQFVAYVQKELNDSDSADAEMMKTYILIITFATDKISENIIRYIDARLPFSKRDLAVSRIYGKLLHSCSEDWQQNFMKKLLASLNENYESVRRDTEQDQKFELNDSVKSILEIFSRAIWHDEKFVLLFSYDNLKQILFFIILVFTHHFHKLQVACKLLDKIKEKANLFKEREKEKEIEIEIEIEIERKEREVSKCLRFCASDLELTLGLFRTRLNSADSIKQLMIPDSEFNTNFIVLLNQFTKFYKKNSLSLICFLEIDLDKSKFDEQIPPIINAVKYYLTSEDDSDAIRIVGIASEDESSE
jgi:hypothetical protein